MKYAMILTIATTILMGCSHSPPSAPEPTVVDLTCVKMRIIRFSESRDSPETIAQIRRQNAAIRAGCKDPLPALIP